MLPFPRDSCSVVALILCLAARAAGQMHGMVHDSDGSPVAGAQVAAHSSTEKPDRTVLSASDGSFAMPDLKPGHYQYKATKRGFADSPVIERDLIAGEDLTVTLTLGANQ